MHYCSAAANCEALRQLIRHADPQALRACAQATDLRGRTPFDIVGCLCPLTAPAPPADVPRSSSVARAVSVARARGRPEDHQRSFTTQRATFLALLASITGQDSERKVLEELPQSSPTRRLRRTSVSTP